MYTFWDYKRNRWPRDAGLRIDYLLLSRQAATQLVAAGVDREPRGEETPAIMRRFGLNWPIPQRCSARPRGRDAPPPLAEQGRRARRWRQRRLARSERRQIARSAIGRGPRAGAHSPQQRLIAKPVAALLRQYGSLDAILKSGRFPQQAENLRLFRSIATMNRKAPLPRLADQKSTWAEAAALAREWELRQLAGRLEELARPRVNRVLR